MKDILKFVVSKGFLLDGEMLNFFEELDDKDVASEILDKIGLVSGRKFITKEMVGENMDKFVGVFSSLRGDKKKVVDKYFVNVSISVEVKKADTKSVNLNPLEKKYGVKILSNPVMASQKLVVRDFVKHFRNRYVFIQGLLQGRRELEGLTSIDKISGGNFSIIGIINKKSITKNKNILLEIEDLTGKVNLLINQSREEVYEKAKEILLDDVVGFKCTGSREFIFANDIVYPDSPLKEKNYTEEEVFALFISDIHVGSNNFLEKNFERFLDWLNGKNANVEQMKVLEKIKYIFVVGDTVEGVGIYPGQEKGLTIKDMKMQYDRLAEFYKRIPKRIKIIQCAGQHDAVRVAEPQPPVGEEFASSLMEFENLYLVSNPSMVEIGEEGKKGLKILMYHGASMHGVINEIEELRLGKAHSTPAKVVKHLLLRRHLAPSHGSVIYIPNAEEDSMLIKEVPDVVATGDLHKTDIDNYNGIVIICSSCWQSITAFEEKVGNKPDPCKVPILNLKTRQVKVLDFSDDG